jgi:xylulokinase
LARKSGIKIDEIRSIGGGSKSKLWNQIKADVLGIPIVILQDSNGAAVGDAYLAGIGSGIFTDIRSTLKSNIKIESKYQPQQAVHTYYQERYARFRSLYESLKNEFDYSAASAEYKVGK